jgi:hypothetical protein
MLTLKSADEAAGRYSTLIAEFAFAAACAPAHDDALNDLSSTPPVSSARHAFVAAALAAGAEIPNVSVAAARTATNLVVFFKVPPRNN